MWNIVFRESWQKAVGSMPFDDQEPIELSIMAARDRARETNPLKGYKITEEDWRNRDKWDQYKLAVNDMVAHTSTEQAPWVLVPGNNKKFARVTIINTVCQRLEEILDPEPNRDSKAATEQGPP